MDKERRKKLTEEMLNEYRESELEKNRLQIAAQIMPTIMACPGEYFYYHNGVGRALISRDDPNEVARVALIYAEALITESAKLKKS